MIAENQVILKTLYFINDSLLELNILFNNIQDIKS